MDYGGWGGGGSGFEYPRALRLDVGLFWLFFEFFRKLGRRLGPGRGTLAQ